MQRGDVEAHWRAEQRGEEKWNTPTPLPSDHVSVS